jgi:hypothetical protein
LTRRSRCREPSRRVVGQVVSDGKLEDGVDAQGVVLVLVLVTGQDAVDAGAGHLQEGVLGEVGVAGVVEGAGVGPGEPDALIELMGSSPASLDN